ncbi:sensor histidine kinase [Microbacterium mangrovi]|nr:HAMP domain-containing sensor histidine kinase [Microbacterium mangrovi]
MVFLRSALDASLDSQVEQLSNVDVWSATFDAKTENGTTTFTAKSKAPGVNYSVAIYDARGKQLATAVPDGSDQPVFPESFPTQETAVRGTDAFSLDGTDGSGFRASVSTFVVPGSTALYTQLVALPTTTGDKILATYLGIYSVLAMLTIILGAVGTRWLVTLAFRSLGQVESTAMSIAAGDFSQRLTDIEPEHTEVGRLKLAINAMLGRVDAALGARDATVRQMRRFIGDASHELRTPLVTVRGYAELYRMGAISSDEDIAQAMERIEKEAIRMGVMVEDLLALTRLDERREEVELVAVHLRPIAYDAALDVRAVSSRVVRVVDSTRDNSTRSHAPAAPTPAPPGPGAKRRSGSGGLTGARSLLRRRPRGSTGPIEPLPPEALAPVAPEPPVGLEPIVLGDENRIRQVVTNLLANARRYTPDDSPIELGVGLDEAARIGWIDVIDHGPGIPDQIKHQIFQRFWRADNSRTRETGGSGLGLAIVASIVEALHGTVEVLDTPGGGATFRIAFPLAEDAARAAQLSIETQPIDRLDLPGIE